MKEFTFDAAHRIMKHKGKCYNLHGHTYKLQVFLSSEDLNLDDMIIDFGDIKTVIKNYLDDNLDHATILNREDKELYDFVVRQDYQYTILDADPTAEYMAEYLYCALNNLISAECNVDIGLVSKIRLYETPTAYAEYK
jgi:6-pyruvoyltetrahydropterin/6-carboxytetrahydropterin synthase